MTEHSDHVHGEMDIESHKAMYAGFMSLTKWSVIALAILLALMGLTLV